MIHLICRGEFHESQKILKGIFDDGYMAYDITNTLNKVIMNMEIDRNL